MHRALSVAVAFLGITSLLGSQSSATSVQNRLVKAYPRISWSSAPESGDFDCDGKPDFAFLGKKTNHVFVAVLGSRSTKIYVLRFGIGDGDEASICEEPAEIAVEDLDYNPDEEEPGNVEGSRKSSTCKGIQLSGGECDFFHVYWNHKVKRFSWWRL